MTVERSVLLGVLAVGLVVLRALNALPVDTFTSLFGTLVGFTGGAVLTAKNMTTSAGRRSSDT